MGAPPGARALPATRGLPAVRLSRTTATTPRSESGGGLRGGSHGIATEHSRSGEIDNRCLDLRHMEELIGLSTVQYREFIGYYLSGTLHSGPTSAWL